MWPHRQVPIKSAIAENFGVFNKMHVRLLKTATRLICKLYEEVSWSFENNFVKKFGTFRAEMI